MHSITKTTVAFVVICLYLQFNYLESITNFMSSWKRLSQLERQVEANSLLPQPQKHDCKFINIRQVLIERIGLGLQKLTPTLLNKIKNNGYDNYIIESVNSKTKLGRSLFYELVNLGKLELTNEYIAFHYFRDKIKNSSRIGIAQLLSQNFDL
jgi:hypothetical protein